jgi:hypothetical protein
VDITIQTGNDQARGNSELQAKLAGSVSICLKPSSTSDASPGGVCTNGSGATWPNGATVTQTFSLSPSLVLDNSGIEIDLFQHYSWPDTANNWDIQAITITGYDSQGPPVKLLDISVPLSGDNCMARLKEAPNPSSVTYALSSNDPSGVNQTHPVPNFGPTPPGSCPQ